MSTAICNNLGFEDFWTDMPIVRDAMRFDLDDFRSTLRELEAGASNIDRAIKAESEAEYQESSAMCKCSKQYLNKLVPFLQHATNELVNIVTLFKHVEQRVACLCTFFAEDTNTKVGIHFAFIY